ncbi:MAG TPA: hypothetical protein VFZ66_04970 [Herpetosiphonaceae bacterium]
MAFLSSMSNDDLAQRCAEETEKFNSRQENDPTYCFELMRRALADESDEAFTRIYQIYERQVLNWVYSHNRFTQTGESADFFATSAMRTFYFALRGEKFSKFPSLPQTLSYLKMCVHTAIAQYLRDQQPNASMPLGEMSDVPHTPDLGGRIDAAELWTHICRLLPDDRDQLLARCVFLLDLKPRQIVTEHPTQWRNEREVSVALYRIRRVLRNDAMLQRMSGMALNGQAE